MKMRNIQTLEAELPMLLMEIPELLKNWKPMQKLQNIRQQSTKVTKIEGGMLVASGKKNWGERDEMEIIIFPQFYSYCRK